MNNLGKKHYLIVGIWFLANLLQAIFTGLHSDESYYWMYSQSLDWGFFDHPPMVAVLIFAGQWLLPGEMGVRLLIVLISTITFALILNELNEKKDLLFAGIFMLSFPLIHTHISGFLAIPDVPLLFFSILFLLVYRNFLERPGWRQTVLLSVLIAAMIYSKYHAFLIVGFTVLSNLKLFKSKYFYGIVTLTLILLLPHLLWQVENEFPTFKYHLVERAKPFQLKYVFPYLAGLLVAAGPLSGILIFWKLRRYKPATLFQRALLFNILGFFALFFVMSFKNRIELHWVAAVIPMLMLISYPLISEEPVIKRWFKRLAVPVIVLMLMFRIYIAMDFIPNVGQLKITFYNREAGAREIEKLAEGKDVAFFNNYAAASNYAFYTGHPVVHLSTPDYRFCQYDLWDDETPVDGKPLFAVQSRHMNPPVIMKTITGEKKGFVVIEKFLSLKGLQIQYEKSTNLDDGTEFTFLLTNTNQHPVITSHEANPCLAVSQNKAELAFVPLNLSSEKESIAPGGKAQIKLFLPKNRFSKQAPLVFYTRTKENIRGEILFVKPGKR